MHAQRRTKQKIKQNNIYNIKMIQQNAINVGCLVHPTLCTDLIKLQFNLENSCSLGIWE